MMDAVSQRTMQRGACAVQKLFICRTSTPEHKPGDYFLMCCIKEYEL